jgi:DNA-directed RNA polymerase subunit RPC12/RpoP
MLPCFIRIAECELQHHRLASVLLGCVMPRNKMVAAQPAPGEQVIESHLVPAFRGSGGGYDYECAGCSATLIENVAAGQFLTVNIRCPQCGTVCRASLKAPAA